MEKFKSFLNKHYIKIVIALSTIAILSGVFALIIGTGSNTQDEVVIKTTVRPEKTTAPKKTVKTEVKKEAKATQEPEEAEEDINDEEISDEKIEETKAPSQKTTETKKEQQINSSEEINKKTVCTISVNCSSVLDNIEDLVPEKKGIIPKDGWMLKPQKIEFDEGETAFDVLSRVLKKEKIHFEFVKTPAYNSVYVEGIGNLYEFDCGPSSGWQYKVNGEVPMVGSSQYVLKDGDTVEYIFTCDFGADL